MVCNPYAPVCFPKPVASPALPVTGAPSVRTTPATDVPGRVAWTGEPVPEVRMRPPNGGTRLAQSASRFASRAGQIFSRVGGVLALFEVMQWSSDNPNAARSRIQAPPPPPPIPVRDPQPCGIATKILDTPTGNTGYQLPGESVADQMTPRPPDTLRTSSDKDNLDKISEERDEEFTHDSDRVVQRIWKKNKNVPSFIKAYELFCSLRGLDTVSEESRSTFIMIEVGLPTFDRDGHLDIDALDSGIVTLEEIISVNTTTTLDEAEAATGVVDIIEDGDRLRILRVLRVLPEEP